MSGKKRDVFITIKLFAILRQAAGRDELISNISSGTVANLLEQVTRDYPALKDLVRPGRIMVSVNHEFVRMDAPVKDGDDVALMPPFSGGSREEIPNRKIEISKNE